MIVKPISTWEDQKILKLKTKKGGHEPTIIDNQIKYLRLGAFEVQIFKKEGGKAIEKILHSKLQSGNWPAVSQVLEKIHYYLPRIPKLTIKLFRDEKGELDDSSDKETASLFADAKVTIKSSYTGTQSQFQLEQFLQIQESQRVQE